MAYFNEWPSSLLESRRTINKAKAAQKFFFLQAIQEKWYDLK